jgi:hypothetical protein
MIVACQVMDPGSIPGERIFLLVNEQGKQFRYEEWWRLRVVTRVIGLVV